MVLQHHTILDRQWPTLGILDRQTMEHHFPLSSPPVQRLQVASASINRMRVTVAVGSVRMVAEALRDIRQAVLSEVVLVQALLASHPARAILRHLHPSVA